jgi:hypothetical protein
VGHRQLGLAVEDRLEDLADPPLRQRADPVAELREEFEDLVRLVSLQQPGDEGELRQKGVLVRLAVEPLALRSEERREGKERNTKCRTRRAPDQ